ncbi:hypothetical protein L6260_01910 [Candidatus Parcubacteria bacterium]|nr:hypothetical protein [Candidatus Parcubacteria bacterium]
MKKVLFSLLTLVILGGGCTALPKTVQGDWYLAFDVPNGWVMVEPYLVGSQAVPNSEPITRDTKDVILQSTSKGVWTSANEPSEETLALIGEVETEDFAFVRVLKLDDRRVIPSEAEDIGNDFYKLKLCDDGGDCQANGRYNYDYYLATDSGKYQFIVTLKGQSIDEAEDVILSAQEVTLE